MGFCFVFFLVVCLVDGSVYLSENGLVFFFFFIFV